MLAETPKNRHGSSKEKARYARWVLFRILGRVDVVGDDGEVIALKAGRQRALLARLILDANRVVRRSDLVESVWGGALPVHPETALQVVVSRLRTNLGSNGRRIVAEDAGYRLDARPEEVDLLWAESLLHDGRLALAGEEGARAADLFDRALSMWTGGTVEEIDESSYSDGAAHRLRELRVMLVEARNDAYLMDGRHLEVLGDIDAWVASEPLREHLRAQQIAALYRPGAKPKQCGLAKNFARHSATKSGWIPRSRYNSSSVASWTRTRASSRPMPGS